MNYAANIKDEHKGEKEYLSLAKKDVKHKKEFINMAHDEHKHGTMLERMNRTKSQALKKKTK